MDPVQRRVALVLIQFRTAIAIQQFSFSILIVVRIPVLGPKTRRQEHELKRIN